LKAVAAQSTELTAMQAELEGRSPAARTKAPRAIWTREFLASGKIGKQS
jgi:hypothetical protein